VSALQADDEAKTLQGRAPSGESFWSRLFRGLPPRPGDLAAIVGVCVLAALVSGYHFGVIDQAIFVPYAKHVRDGGIYGDDLLLQTLPYMHPLFWGAVGVVGRLIPLGALILGLHVLSTLLTGLAVYALGCNLFADRRSALLAVILVAVSVHGRCTPGGDALLLAGPELSQRSFALPWLLWGMTLALAEMPVAGLALAGLMFNVHPFSALITGAMIGAAMLVGRTRSWCALGGGAAAFLACAAPMMAHLGMLQNVRALAPVERQQWIEIVRMRSAAFLSPASLPPQSWVGAGLVVLLGARSFVARRPRGQRDMMALAFAVVPLVLWAPALIFSEVVPVRGMMLAQLGRGTKFAFLIGLLYFSDHQVRRLRGSAVEVAAAMGSLLIPPLLWVSLKVPLLIAPLHLLVGAGPRRAKQGRRLAAALVAFAIPLAALCWRAVDRAQLRVAEGRAWWGGAEAQWLDVQEWVRANLPRGEALLTLPEMAGFRAFSERPVVAEYKDGGAHQYRVQNLIEWWDRMQAMGVRRTGERGAVEWGFTSLREGELGRLTARFGARHIVTRSGHELAWERVYDNGSYAVLRAPEGAGAPGGPRGPAARRRGRVTSR